MSIDERPTADELEAATRRYPGTVEHGRHLRRRRRLGLASSAVGVAVVAVAVAVLLLPGGSSTQKVIVASPAPTPTVTAPPSTAPPSTAPASTAPASTGESPTTVAVGSGATVAVAVPTVLCETLNASERPPSAVPAAVTMQLPSALVGTVAVYADAEGVQRILAPRGWSCDAEDAADGSSGLAVFPSSEHLDQGGGASHVSPGSTVEAVVAAQTAACSTCTSGAACALFPTAAASFESQLSKPCPSVAPAGEQITRINADLVAYEDPSGVAGLGTPSGGRYPANSVQTYYPGNDLGSWSETCTLPPAERQLCTVSLDAFIAAYGNN